MPRRPARRFSIQRRPSGDLQRRLLLHHAPLALASAVVLVLFMTVPTFDANRYRVANIFTGWWPSEGFPGGSGSAGGGHQPPQQEGGGHQPPEQQERGHRIPPEILEQIQKQQGEGETVRTPFNVPESTLLMRELTFSTGYVALGLVGLTLLIGPANLLLRRRNPVSSYFRRDVGAWAALGSGAHVAFGILVDHGGGFVRYFVAPDGGPVDNSFGLGNYTGLAALVIVAGLLALSSDAALRKLKAKNWKRLQRLNYALFALIIVHSVFYGAVVRTDSPYTLLLLLSVIAIFVAQTVGVWLYQRRYARKTAEAV